MSTIQDRLIILRDGKFDTANGTSAQTMDTMFAKLMSISDVMMWRYYELLSFKSLAEIAAYKAQVANGQNPRDIKVALAQEIVARFHSQQAAQEALADFNNRAKGGIPDDIPEVSLSGAPLGIGQLLKQALEKIGSIPEEAIPALTDMLRTDARRSAAACLSKFGPQAAPAVHNVATEQSNSVVVAVYCFGSRARAWDTTPLSETAITMPAPPSAAKFNRSLRVFNSSVMTTSRILGP